ncbi:hypothetical protein BGX29_007989 [Mortierella sp. GBA35]|nr:hypothetical protein BGX29_007989 [Mortierella sp. GBA35]
MPSPILGSRTPMHLVHISNRKLHQEVFSNRAQSIHRRIVIRNFLTVLYQLHPIEWIEPSPAVDDKDQWLEQTLSAAGIDSQQDDDNNDDDLAEDHYPDSHHHDSKGLADLSPPAAAAASAVASRRRPLSLRSNRVPLPRPASVELSQSLSSYLSTVFDVNWSVSGQSNTEDSFVTTTSNPSSPSLPSTGPSSSSLSSRTQAHLSRKPSGRRTAIGGYMEPETAEDNNNNSTARHQQDYLQEASFSSRSNGNNGRGTDINYKVDESRHHHRHGKVASTSRAGPESRTLPSRPSTPPPSSAKAAATATTTIKGLEKYAPPRPERPSSPSAMPYTLTIDPPPSLQQPLQPNYTYAAPGTGTYEPVTMLPPQQHIHNHIHIHVHNYPPEATISTPPRRPTTPPPRSSRYPKPPPPRPTQTMTTTTEYISYSTDYSSSVHSQWAGDPEAILAATAAAATANLPHTWQSVSLESPLPTTMTTTTTSYPPEKTANGLLNGGHGRDTEEEEQPYLATSPPMSSRYPRSPPPPPYTQSADDHQSSFAAPLLPSMAPSAFSPFEQQLAYPSSTTKHSVSSFTPILTTLPQSMTMRNASQKLLEYQQYQERQKMFARGDDSDKDGSSSSTSSHGLGFIRRLSRQSPRKKASMTTISAPLPSTLSYSSSSASATNSLSVAVPLYTIGGGLEGHQEQLSSITTTTISNSGSSSSSSSVRHSLQPAAKNAVSMLLKGTLSSVKSGLSRSSSPTPSSASASVSSIGPIGPPMSSSAMTYGSVKASCAIGPQQLYHYPTTMTNTGMMMTSSAPSSPALSPALYHSHPKSACATTTLATVS